MPIELNWVGEDQLDRVAQTRLRCYSSADKELAVFQDRLRTKNPRARVGDHVLAELDGQAVGTATSNSLTMWVRGSAIACQGVAWVGAIKTMRRRGGGASAGIASTIMREVLKRGRERQEVVSALMPFRTSFYEHFGYGIVERRNEWTLPLSVLPSGDCQGMRFFEPGDFAARAQCLDRVNQKGQCDLRRIDEFWKVRDEQAADGFQIVDRPDANGPVRSFMYLIQPGESRDLLRAEELIYEDLPALGRQLCFLSSLKDQHSSVLISLPVDLPLNWLLKETQLPHRPVSHATAKLNQITRMQLRILDHKRFLEALHLPSDVRGSAHVAVHETEGTVARFKVEIEGGRATVHGAGNGDFECTDRVWAAVACGDLPASRAIQLGIASGSVAAADVLDVLGRGPVPFCNEYF